MKRVGWDLSPLFFRATVKIGVNHHQLAMLLGLVPAYAITQLLRGAFVRFREDAKDLRDALAGVDQAMGNVGVEIEAVA